MIEQRHHGHVLAVNKERLGDNLDADATAGATTLVVGDIADFDELGGSVSIDGTVHEYSTVDDDLGTVTLVDPLAADAEVGDPIYVWDTQRLAVAVEYVAQVEIDADDEGDPVEAVIASHLVDDLPDGIRGLVGESVLMEEEDDEWRIVDVLGLDKAGVGTLFYQDSLTVAAPGDQTLNLTHQPIDNSEHLYWDGDYQPGTEWTRDGLMVTVLDPDDFLAAGDQLVMEYAYYGAGTAPESFPAFVTIPYESTGWKYLVVTEGDAVNRSAPGFDDSSWSTGQGAFGYPLSTHPSLGFPAAHTSTATFNAGVWIRRSVATGSADGLNITVKEDGFWTLYADGVVVSSGFSAGTHGPYSVAVTPNTDVVIALHVDDDTSDPGTDYLYADVKVEEA